MPIYDYRCDACGPFTRLTSMANAKAPAACPQCGKAAPRVISAPYLACMTAENRKAWARNEKSAHEPKVRRAGCGCSGAHTCNTKTNAAPAKPSLQQSSNQRRRPWMLGH